MTKPTLDDFLADYEKAIADGYEPTFMCIGAKVASSFPLNCFYNLLELYTEVLNDKAVNLPINLLKIFLATFSVITFPILFPFWWVLFWILLKKHIKTLKERDNRLNELLGD